MNSSNDSFNSIPKISFIGLSRSGKGYATETIIKKLDFVSITISTIIREYAKEKDIELTSRDDFWKVGTEINETFGEVYLLDKATEILKAQVNSAVIPVNGVIYDGMRRPSLVEEFKKMPNSLVVKICADPEIRFMRQREVRTEDTAETLEEFNNNEAKEAKIVEQLDKYVDITITNESSIDDFENEVIDIVSKCFNLKL